MPTIDRRGLVIDDAPHSAASPTPAVHSAIKIPVSVATTEFVVLAGLQTVDGFTLVEGDRVLVKNQLNAVENGIYRVSTGNWTRAVDFDGPGDVVKGTQIFVTDGALNGRQRASVVSDNPIVPGVTGLEFDLSFTPQPDDATLTSLATLNGTAGAVMQTGPDAFIKRTLRGTNSEITVTFGDGVGGDPTMSLPSAITFTGKTVTGGTFNDIAIGSNSTAVTQVQGNNSTKIATTAYADAVGAAASQAYPQGYLFGLTLSNNVSDTVNDIDITAGKCRDDVDTANIALASSITKRLDAAWSVGSGNGGLDTGSIANATYHIWLIKRSDTGVVDALFSTSATSPTMPANYDKKRRIGAIVRKAAAILQFKQHLDDFFLQTSQQDYGSPLTATEVVVALSVPTGIRVKPWVFASWAISSSGEASIKIRTLDLTTDEGVGALGGGAALMNAGLTDHVSRIGTSQQYVIYTNTSGQVGIRAAGTAIFSDVRTAGWTDARGRFS